jgi:hypothetical protein
MARKSNSVGRAPSVGEINDIYRKLLTVVDSALDGEVDPETGERNPPTAAVMETARKIISDARITPSQDVEERIRDVDNHLPMLRESLKSEF